MSLSPTADIEDLADRYSREGDRQAAGVLLTVAAAIGRGELPLLAEKCRQYQRIATRRMERRALAN